MTYHTSRYISSKVWASQVLVQQVSHIFVSNCETAGTMDLLLFSMATTKCTALTRP